MATIQDYFNEIPKTAIDLRLTPEVGLTAVVKPSSTGDFQVEALHGNGQNCLKLTSLLEQKLGAVSSRDMKPEADGPEDSQGSYIGVDAS